MKYRSSNTPSGRLGDRRGQKERGSLHIPLLLGLLALSTAGFGTWGFLRNWRHLMETQLRLDRCVGQAAQEFRDRMNSLESDNLKIKALRASAGAAPHPAAKAALIAATATLVIKQDVERGIWTAAQLKWVVKRGCGERGDWGFPLPGMGWIRRPPDPSGPQPLGWTGMPEVFRFEARHGSRSAAATVTGGTQGGQERGKKRIASWAQPRLYGLTGPDFR